MNTFKRIIYFGKGLFISTKEDKVIREEIEEKGLGEFLKQKEEATKEGRQCSVSSK